MDSTSSPPKYITIDFCYNGVFKRSPLSYINGDVRSISEVDFGGMDCQGFLTYLRQLTNCKCENVYYSNPKKQMDKSITRIHNDPDFYDFIEEGYLNTDGVRRMLVYIDDNNSPVIDWVDQEGGSESEDDDYECQTEDEGEDVEDDDDLEYDPKEAEHQKDDEVYTFDKTVGDDFLHKISGVNLNTGSEGDDSSDAEEDDDQSTPVHPVFDEKLPWNKMVPMVGMKFASPADLKWCLANYAVKNGYNLWYDKNDSSRLLVRCGKTDKGPGCPFRLWATWMPNEKTFQIKSLTEEHNCARVFKLGSIVTYKWIGRHYMNVILQKPKLSLRQLKAKVSKKFNISVSLGQCRNARRFAFSEVEGCLIEHYGKIWSYAEEIKRTNPGSTVSLDVDIMPDETTYFSRFYVCFKGVRDGWIAGCRRVIGLDGCFLKGICRGQLLAAVGRDANNHIYPLAWAVVAVENKDTWKWFVGLLLDDIDMGMGQGLTLISDGHKGLIEAIKERVPEAEHRLCARHICANFRKRFTGEHWRKLFWRVAGATTEAKYKAAMNDIRIQDQLAYDHLMERQPRSWCRAFFVEGRACDAYENGISESFNAVIEAARKRPLLTMLEEIRVYVMDRLYQQKLKGESWNLEICPSIRYDIEQIKKQQRHWSVFPAGHEQFEVRIGNEAYTVDLQRRTCGCRSWQVSGVPCVHGTAAISSLNRNIEHYVSSWYSTANYLSTYNHNIWPLNGSDLWPEVYYKKPLPPKKRRLPGRPSLKRKRDQVERADKGQKHKVSKAGTVLRCTICRERGHNRSTCSQKPKDGPSTTKSRSNKAKNAKKPKVVVPDQVQHGEDGGVPDPVPEGEDGGVPDQVQHGEDGGVPDPVPEGEDGGVPDQVQQTSIGGVPTHLHGRQKKVSARIAKLKLKKKVDRKEGSSPQDPLDLE